jgi:two-component system sensor histidine kinase AlgZ
MGARNAPPLASSGSPADASTAARDGGHSACMRPDMQSIIRQNGHYAARLPDFRNLGTILRILVAVNAAAVVAAVAGEPQLERMPAAIVEAAAGVELPLLLALVVLWIASPALARLPYRAGALAVTVIGIAATLGAHTALTAVAGPSRGTLLREVLLALVATAVLLSYFHMRARALSPAITEARLQALQARIRPHFLFNSINAVMSIVRHDPKRAEYALQDMADLFRVLMRDNRDLAPLADEVELCRQYLELEKLRLGERLAVDWNVKSMPEDALSPPLVLQPLLENAVYHGIEPSSSPGTISVNIFLSRGEVHMILRNPYRASSGGHHAGNKMALANVRERLALHFDAEAALESRVLPDAYEVHIRLPYRTVAPPRVVARTETPGAAQADAAQDKRPRSSPRWRLAHA